MKKVLLSLFLLISISSFSQTHISNNHEIFNKSATFNSTVKITTGASNGKILTSDSTGNATWNVNSSLNITKYVKLGTDSLYSIPHNLTGITRVIVSEIAMKVNNQYIITDLKPLKSDSANIYINVGGVLVDTLRISFHN